MGALDDSGGKGPGSTPVRRRSGGDLARRGWTSLLAASVAGALVVQGATGLWTYLGPFSVLTQLQVLLHSLLGVLLVVPLVVFLVQHLLLWAAQRMTATMLLGYLLAGVVTACVVSGLVVASQGILGPRLSAFWDLVHLVSGLAATALLPVHLGAAWLRRRRDGQLAPCVRRFALRTGTLVAAAALIVGVPAALWTTAPVETEPPEGYSLPAHVQGYDEYRGSPFAPTNARTHSGLLVAPEVLAGSASCGTSGCHEQILAEWRPSAHRFAAMNPPFQAVQRSFAADREPAETRYCAGCHDPISLFAGAKDIHDQDLAAPGMQEGVSCVVCHAISAVDQRGNADYVLTPPRRYLFEGGEGLGKAVSDFLIRVHPRQHLADYDRNILRTPEFCGACHKQFIPEALNRFGLTQGQNQYDEWRKSHWHADDPDRSLSCRDCHMRLVRGSRDPGAGEAGDTRRSPDDGAHRHHGTIATNVLMPEVLRLPGWERHVELTREWMRGEAVLPEIADVWPGGPVAGLRVAAPESVAPGGLLRLRVVVTNRKVGHNLTTGPLDFMRLWVHLTVKDAEGSVLGEWGGIDPQTRRIQDEPGVPHRIGNSRSRGTLVLEGMPLDASGAPLLEHQLWRKAGGHGRRVIFPRYADNQVYELSLPGDVSGPLSIRADLNFRRYRQDFLDRVVPDMEAESGVIQPTVTQARTCCEVAVGPPSKR